MSFPVSEMFLPIPHVSIPKFYILHKSFISSKYHFLIKGPYDDLQEKSEHAICILNTIYLLHYL